MKYGLDEIKTFLAVVESGSISGASTRLATKAVVRQRVTHLRPRWEWNCCTAPAAA